MATDARERFPPVNLGKDGKVNVNIPGRRRGHGGEHRRRGAIQHICMHPETATLGAAYVLGRRGDPLGGDAHR